MKVIFSFKENGLAIVALALCFVVSATYNFCCDPCYCDYIAMSKRDLTFDWIINSYNTWSSRILLDVLNNVMCHNILLWRIINMVILCAIPIVTYWTFKSSKSLVVSSAVVMLFPFYLLASAGPIAVSVVYLWPAFTLFLSLCLLKKIFDGNKTVLIVTFFVLSTIFSVFMELYAVIVLSLYAILIILERKQGERQIILYIGLVIGLLGVLNFILCPGNWNRNESEMHWLPQFEYFSIFEKATFAVMQTSRVVFDSSMNAIILLFVMTVALIAFENGRQKSFFASIVAIMILAFYKVDIEAKIILDNIPTGKPELLIPIIPLVIVAILLYYSMVTLSENKVLTYGMVTLVFVSVGCYTLSCMSPTALATIGRTFIPAFTALSISIATLLIQSKNKLFTPSLSRAVYFGFFLFCIVVMVNYSLESISDTQVYYPDSMYVFRH